MSDMIERLITITQLKAANANAETLRGAEAQRGLIQSQKKRREANKALERLTRETLEILEVTTTIVRLTAIHCRYKTRTGAVPHAQTPELNPLPKTKRSYRPVKPNAKAKNVAR